MLATGFQHPENPYKVVAVSSSHNSSKSSKNSSRGEGLGIVRRRILEILAITIRMVI